MRRLSFLCSGLLVIAACKDESVASYELYQDCFDDLVDNKGREVIPALIECCLDHPIDGEAPACGETAPDCVNYLTDNVSQFDASTVEVMDACEDVEDMQDV
jgi:hypothetical protein